MTTENLSKYFPFRLLYPLVYFGFHIILSLVLGENTKFAPDEEGYASLFQKVFQPDFSFKSSEGLIQSQGWAWGVEPLLKILYFPAYVLVLLGVSPLLAIRFLSGALSAATLWILLSGVRKIEQKKNIQFIVLIFLCPSFFLWTSLGLRESFFFLGITVFFKNVGNIWCLKVSSSAKLCVGLLLVFAAKPSFYPILLSSIILSVVLQTLFKKIKLPQFVNSIAACALLIAAPLGISPSMTSYYSEISKAVYFKYFQDYSDSAGIPVQKPTESPSRIDSEQEKGQISIDDLKTNTIGKVLIELSSATQSNLITFSGFRESGSVNDIFRDIGIFLIFPMPFSENGSKMLNIAAFEFPFWILAFVIFLREMLFLRQKLEFTNIAPLAVLIFLGQFLIYSGVFENNLGTSFRHKSVLLILAAILLSIEKSNISPRTRIEQT
jgi:hypothetical protein